MGNAAAASAAFGAIGCRSELSSFDCRLADKSGTELSFPSVEVVFCSCEELFRALFYLEESRLCILCDGVTPFTVAP